MILPCFWQCRRARPAVERFDMDVGGANLLVFNHFGFHFGSDPRIVDRLVRAAPVGGAILVRFFVAARRGFRRGYFDIVLDRLHALDLARKRNGARSFRLASRGARQLNSAVDRFDFDVIGPDLFIFEKLGFDFGRDDRIIDRVIRATR